MRTLGTFALLIGLAACATPPIGPLTLVSDPSGASVRLSDGRDCQTPCTVPLTTPVTATVAKAGYLPATVTLSPAQRGEVSVSLRPAGRAADVEEVELDLEPRP